MFGLGKGVVARDVVGRGGLSAGWGDGWFDLRYGSGGEGLCRTPSSQNMVSEKNLGTAFWELWDGIPVYEAAST